MKNMATINAKQLEQIMTDSAPDYSSRSEGYILVNTLPKNYFEKEHIAQSINVPDEQLKDLKQHFDTDKQIIVYCASTDCDSSLKAAKKLQEMGFRHTTDFEGGLDEWKQIKGKTESGSAQPDFAGVGGAA